MVLDHYDQDRDVLVFKNTYDDPVNGQPMNFEVGRTSANAPEELYFVHIEVRDLENLPSQQQRAEMKKKLFEDKFGDLFKW